MTHDEIPGSARRDVARLLAERPGRQTGDLAEPAVEVGEARNTLVARLTEVRVHR